MNGEKQFGTPEAANARDFLMKSFGLTKYQVIVDTQIYQHDPRQFIPVIFHNIKDARLRSKFVYFIEKYSDARISIAAVPPFRGTAQGILHDFEFLVDRNALRNLSDLYLNRKR